MNKGYVKLWRRSLDAGWLRNHKLWTFWTWCLLKASHQEHKHIMGCQEITLQPGQFIFGREKAAKELRLSEQEIRTIIAFLIKGGNLTIKATNKFSIITIVNWHIYQGSIRDNQPSDQPTTNQPLTTNKNDKNGKNDISICPHEKIIELYNEILGCTLPAVKYQYWPDSSGAKNLSTRWKQSKKHQTEDYWEKLFKYIRDNCPFLMGDNKENWRADLRWIVVKENFIKIVEGKYEKRQDHV